MSYKILILPEAKIDIIEGKLFYKSILQSLGKRFTADVRRTVSNLKKRPLTYGSRFDSFRMANLDIFPYQVHYIIEGENSTVIIFAVLNAYRDPNFIKSRLRK